MSEIPSVRRNVAPAEMLPDWALILEELTRKHLIDDCHMPRSRCILVRDPPALIFAWNR
jgi:hypothetical protein